MSLLKPAVSTQFLLLLNIIKGSRICTKEVKQERDFIFCHVKHKKSPPVSRNSDHLLLENAMGLLKLYTSECDITFFTDNSYLEAKILTKKMLHFTKESLKRPFSVIHIITYITRQTFSSWNPLCTVINEGKLYFQALDLPQDNI